MKSIVLTIFTIILFGSLLYERPVKGESYADTPIIKPLSTTTHKDYYLHSFAVCADQTPLTNELILVSSDSVLVPLRIDKTIEVNQCHTFNATILALDGASIETELILKENKGKIINHLSTKIKSLDKIIEKIYENIDQIYKEYTDDDKLEEFYEILDSKILQIQNLKSHQEMLDAKIKILVNNAVLYPMKSHDDLLEAVN